MNDNNDGGGVTNLTDAPKLQAQRAEMLALLTELITEVAEGRILGMCVATYDGARAYRIRFKGDQDPIILCGEVEALKVAVLHDKMRGQ